MFRNLMENLSKGQKIGLLVVCQAVFVVVLVLIVQGLMNGREYVKIEDTAGVNLPEKVREFVADNIWETIKGNVENVSRNDIDDVVVREETYSETVEDDEDLVRANFIVDIDSIKQTYAISAGWSRGGEVVYEVIVNCPPIDEMKYPETVCYGDYNNSFSLDLYLPYAVYKDGYDMDDDAAMDDEVVAPDIYITGDADEKYIDVMVSKCNAEEFIREADEYLDGLPIDLSGYAINYNINDVNVGC